MSKDTRQKQSIKDSPIKESIVQLGQATRDLFQVVVLRNDASRQEEKLRRSRNEYLSNLEKDLERRWRASIHTAIFIDIGLEENLTATTPLPWLYQSKEISNTFTNFNRAFECFNGRVLLLGQPGSGKTTTLENIALQLVRQAKEHSDAPIPLLVNLSKFVNYARKRASSSVQEWLIEYTTNTYPFISKEIVRFWFQEKQVTLLLDGLDEVDEPERIELVKKLNNYLEKLFPSIPVVVCSRIIEYRPLEKKKETKLKLEGAVELQPLDQEQINSYLEKAVLPNLVCKTN